MVAAALAGLLYMSRQGWKFFQVLERIAYELSPNHGASMKDDLSAVARAVGELQAQVQVMADEKDSAHRSLQIQIDGLIHEAHHPQHKREDPPA